MSHKSGVFCGTFRELITEKFYVNDQKKMRLFLDFGRTFCFLKSDLRKKSGQCPPITILGENSSTPN